MTEHQAQSDDGSVATVTVTEESIATARIDVVPAAAAGARALVGVALAIVGVLTAVNPNSVVLRAVNQAMPQLADALPTLITACGAVLAAFSQPPRLQRRPSADSRERATLRLS
jgi:hypothetical protein